MYVHLKTRSLHRLADARTQRLRRIGRTLLPVGSSPAFVYLPCFLNQRLRVARLGTIAVRVGMQARLHSRRCPRRPPASAHRGWRRASAVVEKQNPGKAAAHPGAKSGTRCPPGAPSHAQERRLERDVALATNLHVLAIIFFCRITPISSPCWYCQGCTARARNIVEARRSNFERWIDVRFIYSNADNGLCPSGPGTVLLERVFSSVIKSVLETRLCDTRCLKFSARHIQETETHSRTYSGICFEQN